MQIDIYNMHQYFLYIFLLYFCEAKLYVEQMKKYYVSPQLLLQDKQNESWYRRLPSKICSVNHLKTQLVFTNPLKYVPA